MENGRTPLLSFFTGGGLLDLGFEKAGFDIVWTNEINNMFADMYEYAVTSWRRARMPDAEAAIISNRNSIADLTAEIVVSEAFKNLIPPLFGVIGGPPCPDFSIAGKQKGGSGKHGRLSQTYVDLIMDIKPWFFVMENVPGLYKIKKHREFLDSLISTLEQDYYVDMELLNALEYGVPQDRERLFVVGITKNSFVSFDKANDGKFRFPWPAPLIVDPKHRFVWPSVDSFGGKPKLDPNLPLELTVYSILEENNNPLKLPNGKEFFKPYSNRFYTVSEGDVSRKSFKRLHRYRYSPTAWYGNNEVHLHPWEPRRLSVREALRIQSVPDEYVLPASYSLTSKFKMIANGVPCKMAKAIAVAMHDFICEQ